MESIQTIELDEDLFDNIRNGTKTAILLNGKYDNRLGTTILYGCARRNVVFIDVTKICYMNIHMITDADAQQEGYPNRESLLNAMTRTSKYRYDPSAIVTQMRFEYIAG